MACIQPAVRCNDNCRCDETGYCIKSCSAQNDCSCGEVCTEGQCRTQCSLLNSCAQGQICEKGLCIPGCKSNTDCTELESCTGRKCQNPCKVNKPCGKNAECRVSEHRAICLCPDGTHGEPTKLCTAYECTQNTDCEVNKQCSDGMCKNPCLIQGACGLNAQCKVVNRNVHCTCPLGYIGNAKVECRQPKLNDCTGNPCGKNANCQDKSGGYECSCLAGCTGDPNKGCSCDIPIPDLCKNKLCGLNALCHVINGSVQCYCPPENPSGDPTIECKFYTCH